ncbi:MAG: hypothetical protein U0821_12715 [Chloroflexota bacterium]
MTALVHQEGLEGALAVLAGQGVYVRVLELKGRTDIVRGSLRFRASPRDFAQPDLRTHYPVPTSGSAGAPIIVARSLLEYRSMAPSFGLAIAAHGQTRPAHVQWQMLPTYLYASSTLGHPLLAWRYPREPSSRIQWLGMRYAWLASRAAGVPLPYPRRSDTTDPVEMARFLAEARTKHPEICVIGYSSAALRLSLTAQRLGISLDHVLFACTGEPLTETRARVIRESGARPLNHYGSTECGSVAFGCANPRAADDAHVATDRFALIRREVESQGVPIAAYHVTSVVPWVATVMLNADMGDFGEVFSETHCCKLGTIGYGTHIARTRSYEKLTGEAVTFVVADAARLVEDVLPSTFGGTPLDFQLAEEEAPSGEMRLVVRAHPALGDIDEQAVRNVVIRELGREGGVAAHMAALWRSAGTVRIARVAPYATPAGKVLPFRARAQGG